MGKPKLSAQEQERYGRQLVLPNFDHAAQLRLMQAKVAVVGCGGLGCPVLQYLCGAGVGHFILVDHDVVNVSNLHRQILFTESDIGKNKTEVAVQRMLAMNGLVQTETYTAKLTSANAIRVLQFADVIVDCSDNFPTRYLLNDVAVKLNKPLVHGAIYRYEGQVGVFNYKSEINYRDLFAEPPAPELVPDCATGGVLGTLAGVIGSIQANEVIKLITGIGEVLDGKIFLFDGFQNTSSVFHLKKNDANTIRPANATNIHLIDYEKFCKTLPPNDGATMIKEITVEELKMMLNHEEDIQLIDVREPFEFDEFNIGGQLIPMSEIPDHVNSISKDKKVVVHCKAGVRSANVIAWLQAEHGFNNLYNLKGGVIAWKQASH
jgi:adenylyltransferase/sulfurtransferase